MSRHLKTGKKKLAGKCLFCPEFAYEVLDAHRVLPGAEGGTYCEKNIIVTCASCHRKLHAGLIVIKGRYPTSSGRVAVFAVVDGIESIFFEPSIIS